MSATEVILKTLNTNTTKVALATYEFSRNSHQNPRSESEGQRKVTLRLTQLLGFGKTAEMSHRKKYFGIRSPSTPDPLLAGKTFLQST